MVLNFFQRIRRALNAKRIKQRYHVDLDMAAYLQDLAVEQDSDPEQVAQEIFAKGIVSHFQNEHLHQIWELLTPREQEVAALVCLGYSNNEISKKLMISPNTVKSHISHAMIKLGVAKRAEIQSTLGDWDFREWDQ
jgi:RNA polymerase sigma factor (sigma-70 family)